MDSSINDRPLIDTKLLQKIHSLRKQLIQTGMYLGLDHEKTINLSQQLDAYIYLYQSIEKDNKRMEIN